ncbi:MAG: DeoR family transcriptional regulator [Rhodospirillaceae bacterium]|jgi:DeoR family glycerol-3-phosphate regulon repressor|uniref:DeoR/GlpR family DNA-binding transcription regulator n=1 Tax=Hwanghaeella sp. 1Z406 TaxID=3402811 RepID=UPI000C4EBC55|nr:DeoR family transcriptional regulator [Rhodospirillales bacterium]MAX48337.1 DeoR family transcriptional regulator [Rhodospirillaceae bacterium]|tara:strand:- start:23360 stop:24139 length:780 start_codon:yes stop_codon:yes gene_type:complete
MYVTTERQAEIAERVRQSGFQSVTDLAQHFGVTTQTIRRDINELSEAGALRRRHGGVELPIPTDNIGFEERQTLNFAAKQQIARVVKSHIPHGASIAISIGTTPALTVHQLSDLRGLTIVTNNLMAALNACSLPAVEVHVPGGAVRPEARDILGPEVEAFFESFKVDIGLYGVGGVDDQGELLDFSRDEVQVREIIRRNCRRSFLVLDASKFGRAAHVRGGWISDADVVFCDRDPPAQIRQAIEAAGHEVVLCSEGGAP